MNTDPRPFYRAAAGRLFVLAFWILIAYELVLIYTYIQPQLVLAGE